MALEETRSPWATSRTRNLTKSQARSLLSIASSNSAKSRVLSASCSLTRMAQISLSRSGAFWPTSLPLFHGSRVVVVEVFMAWISTDGMYRMAQYMLYVSWNLQSVADLPTAASWKMQPARLFRMG